MNDRIENAEGYYSLPRIVEPYEGEVIKLDAKSLNLLYQTYSNNGDPHQFVEKLEQYDEWFQDKPHKVYADGKWLNHIIKWMIRDKQQHEEREQ